MKNYLIILLLVASGNLFGQDSFQKELFSTYVVLKYKNNIDLSEKQVTNVKKIYEDNISSFNSIKKDLDTELQSLSKLLASSKIDADASLKLMDKVTALEDKLKRIRLSMLIKIKNELTPAQQEKLKKLRTENDIKSLSLTTALNDDQKINITIGGDKMGKNKPLFIIIDKKGKRTVTGDYFEKIEPSDIESVEVFKGEKALELYGEKGKNGVVVIKLKK